MTHLVDQLVMEVWGIEILETTLRLRQVGGGEKLFQKKSDAFAKLCHRKLTAPDAPNLWGEEGE